MNKIIIAEDNSYLVEEYIWYFKEIIKKEVEFVTNGQELVKKAREHAYSIIFTDYNMPVMTGLEAIVEIRKFDSKVPIYVVSGDLIEDQSINVGATGYIEKSDIEAMEKIIKKYE